MGALGFAALHRPLLAVALVAAGGPAALEEAERELARAEAFGSRRRPGIAPAARARGTRHTGRHPRRPGGAAQHPRARPRRLPRDGRRRPRATPGPGARAVRCQSCERPNPACALLRGLRPAPRAGVRVVRPAQRRRRPLLQRLRPAAHGRRDAAARGRGACPARVHTQAPGRQGERKQVTVLFADVKGSMELAEQVDPEEWHGSSTASSRSWPPACTASRARSTSTPATASWRSSARPSPTRTTPSGPAMRRCTCATSCAATRDEVRASTG